MSQIKKLFLYWQIVTALFILVSGSVVAGVVIVRSWELEEVKNKEQRATVEHYIVGDYVEMAGNLYSKYVDDLKLREQKLQEMMKGNANVEMKFTRFESPVKMPNVSALPKLKWTDKNTGLSFPKISGQI